MNNVLDRINNGKTTVSVGIDNNNQTPEQVADSKELLYLARRGARYRWVPVAERLPDKGEVVDVYNQYDGRVPDVEYEGDGVWTAQYARWHGVVNHWVPISGPEEEG